MTPIDQIEAIETRILQTLGDIEKVSPLQVKQFVGDIFDEEVVQRFVDTIRKGDNHILIEMGPINFGKSVPYKKIDVAIFIRCLSHRTNRYQESSNQALGNALLVEKYLNGYTLPGCGGSLEVANVLPTVQTETLSTWTVALNLSHYV